MDGLEVLRRLLDLFCLMLLRLLARPRPRSGDLRREGGGENKEILYKDKEDIQKIQKDQRTHFIEKHKYYIPIFIYFFICYCRQNKRGFIKIVI